MVSEPAPPLRDTLLATRPEDIGLRPTAALPHVWAALLELSPSPGLWASVVAIADGTASLYTSGSFGVIGAGQHEDVRSVAETFLLRVEQAYGELTEVGDLSRIPYPDHGSVAVVALSYDGARRAVLATDASAAGPVAEAVASGYGLLTQIRIAEERVDRGDATA
jgi:hypothetical protein